MCKGCTQFLSETFSFRKVVPPELAHPSYCMNCFDAHVAGPLSDYNDKMEKAKDIIIYGKDQGKLTRFLKRKADPYHVENCEDEEEVFLRMSYFAVEANFNCLIDVVTNRKTLSSGSHKKSCWSGTAVPVTIDPNEIRGHMDPR